MLGRAESYLNAFVGGFWKAIPKPGEEPVSLGSICIAKAESMEAVLDTLKGDLYYKNRVWDWDKVRECSYKLFDLH